jgi:hypothetical protein
MDLKVFSPHELPVVLAALRHVAVENGCFTDAERALVEGVARIHDVELDADSLPAVDDDEVARVVVDPHRRKRMVQLAIVMALVEGAPSEASEASVQKLARALDLDEPGLDVLYEMAEGHAFYARFDMLRRVGRFMRNAPGFPGIARFVAPVLGLGFGTDARVAAQYRVLESCARGTFGRAFYDHFVNNGFKFPGEPRGVPLIFHDVGHVLSGYGVDPQGEIQQAAFQAGFARRDGFTFLLFGILQFHLGLRLTPVAKGYQGLLDVPRVLTALDRGAACKIDLVDGFDLWGHKDRSLEAVRAELGIPPLRVFDQAG